MQKLNVYWTLNAQSELKEIIEYIKHDSLPQAKKIFNRIKTKSLILSEYPYIGKTIPELEQYNISIYREFTIDVWRIIYTHKESGIYILSVLDSRRDISELLFDKLFKI